MRWADQRALERWLRSTEAEHNPYPHEPGRLHGCAACESRCHCSDDPGTTECIWEQPEPGAMPDAHRFSRTWLEQLAESVQELDFDHCFMLQPAGMLGTSNQHAPEVEHDDESDILIHDMRGERWKALTGMTGQHGYNGAVMHSSEFIGASIARRLMRESADEPQTFVVTVVDVLDEPDDPAGWCILQYVGDTGE